MIKGGDVDSGEGCELDTQRGKYGERGSLRVLGDLIDGLIAELLEDREGEEEGEEEGDDDEYAGLLELYLNSRCSSGSVYSGLDDDGDRDGDSPGLRRKVGIGDVDVVRGRRGGGGGFGENLDLKNVDLGTVSGRLDDKFETRGCCFLGG